jgi:hypothetical protein
VPLDLGGFLGAGPSPWVAAIYLGLLPSAAGCVWWSLRRGPDAGRRVDVAAVSRAAGHRAQERLKSCSAVAPEGLRHTVQAISQRAESHQGLRNRAIVT